MKVKKLGIEWGAAFEEATPIRISTGHAEIEVFEAENGDIVVVAPTQANISVGQHTKTGALSFHMTVADQF